MKNNDVILRIQKLLALSESPNENESRVAMLKAQELLFKYKLSIQDIEDSKYDKDCIVKEVTDITFTKAKWKGILAETIARNFYCSVYFLRVRTNRVVFIGKKEDVYVCRLVYNYAIDCIYSKVKYMQCIYKREGKSIKGLETDYALGFIKGLRSSFCKQKLSNKELALSIIGSGKLDRIKSLINAKRSINMNSKLSGFYNEFKQGQNDGENFNISNRIDCERMKINNLLKKAAEI